MRDPRQRDPLFLAWLHVNSTCIACLVEGPPPAGRFPIEAAHQKLAIASKGWREGGLGPRIHDYRACPLCSYHHRLAPDACDMGQRQFWDRLGLGDSVADFVHELYIAYQAGAPIRPVIERWAERACQSA